MIATIAQLWRSIFWPYKSMIHEERLDHDQLVLHSALVANKGLGTRLSYKQKPEIARASLFFPLTSLPNYSYNYVFTPDVGDFLTISARCLSISN